MSPSSGFVGAAHGAGAWEREYASMPAFRPADLSRKNLPFFLSTRANKICQGKLARVDDALRFCTFCLVCPGVCFQPFPQAALPEHHARQHPGDLCARSTVHKLEPIHGEVSVVTIMLQCLTAWNVGAWTITEGDLFSTLFKASQSSEGKHRTLAEQRYSLRFTYCTVWGTLGCEERDEDCPTQGGHHEWWWSDVNGCDYWQTRTRTATRRTRKNMCLYF